MAIGATAQSKGRQEGIVNVADATESGGRVPDDADGFDLIAKGIGHLLVVAMDCGAMS